MMLANITEVLIELNGESDSCSPQGLELKASFSLVVLNGQKVYT